MTQIWFIFILFTLVFGSIYTIGKSLMEPREALLFSLVLCVGITFAYRLPKIMEGLNHRTRLTNMKQNGLVNVRVPDVNSAEWNFTNHILDGMADGTVNIWRTDGWSSGLAY